MQLVGRVVGQRLKEEVEKLEGGDSVTHSAMAIEVELEPDMRTNVKKPSKAVILVPVDDARLFPIESPARITIELPQQRLDLGKGARAAAKAH